MRKPMKEKKCSGEEAMLAFAMHFLNRELVLARHLSWGMSHWWVPRMAWEGPIDSDFDWEAVAALHLMFVVKQLVLEIVTVSKEVPEKRQVHWMEWREVRGVEFRSNAEAVVEGPD